MKKLFKNYEFEFDNNQKKIITSFSKQAVKQMESDERFARDVNIFKSIIDKLSSAEEKVKLTKEEKTRLSFQLKENTKHLDKKVKSSWFLTKWFYKNMLNQYNNILSIFED
ncbi:MAG: hypothetical protein HYS24_01330 [Ignavibacteriales bacterium]|jgi:hypothetical protein|nr:hypothetical protein [Ignavibacteriales bacterium]MBK7981544.1 hypothetical protein [Ignavibacteriota bacterium]